MAKNHTMRPLITHLLAAWLLSLSLATPAKNTTTSKTSPTTKQQLALLDKDYLSRFSGEKQASAKKKKHEQLFILRPTIKIDERPATNRQQTSIDVAIIIDDIGYSKTQGLAAINLPGKLTFAVIPHSPNAEYLATEAHSQQKELILHAPMSNIHNHPIGQAGLTDTMSEADFNKTLADALDSVPHISGVNNHMGSLLTQKKLPMEWTMKTLKKHGLYFVDSRTTPESIAWQTAQQFNVASLKRDVFLDHQRDTVFIEEQFQRLISIAKRQGYAIAIGHPYPETIDYLKENLGRLKDQGIHLKTASEVVNHYSPNKQ